MYAFASFTFRFLESWALVGSEGRGESAVTVRSDRDGVKFDRQGCLVDSDEKQIGSSVRAQECRRVGKRKRSESMLSSSVEIVGPRESSALASACATLIAIRYESLSLARSPWLVYRSAMICADRRLRCRRAFTVMAHGGHTPWICFDIYLQLLGSFFQPPLAVLASLLAITQTRLTR